MKRLPGFIFFALVTLSGASEGASRLHFAAAIGDSNAIESLLAARADVNARAENGCTPLHAALNGYLFAMDVLVSAGADVNAKARNGITPLHEAARYGTWNAGAIATLISAGADVNVEGQRRLHPLARCGHV